MQTYKELYRLILGGESQVLDFKKTISHPEKIAKTLAAFANTRGGQLIVGVLDNGEIVGANIEEEAFQLHKANEQYCRPLVPLELLEVEDGHGHSLLLVTVPESPEKPHAALDKNNVWTVYVRMNDHSVAASKENMRIMHLPGAGLRGELPKEGKAILLYLQKSDRITAKLLAKLLNISERRARRALVDMAREGWLLSHDFEKEVFYTKLGQ